MANTWNYLLCSICIIKYDSLFIKKYSGMLVENLEGYIPKSFILNIIEIWNLAYNTNRCNVCVFCHEIMEDVV